MTFHPRVERLAVFDKQAPAQADHKRLSLWRRASRFSFVRSRLTRRRLDAFVAGHASDTPALVVHSHDVDHRRHFPNGTHLSSQSARRPDVLTDPQYGALAEMPAESRDLIVCTGLLEHLAEPQLAVRRMSALLRPEGRMIVSASAVFPFHGAPDNYFHFTPGGFRRLFGSEMEIDDLRGSTGPFETLSVLAQRIALQCEVTPPVRPLIDLMILTLPLLDRAVLRQYDHTARLEPVDPAIGVMPATLVAVARRRLS